MSDSRCMTHDAWLTRPDSRCAKISHDSRPISVFQSPPTRILFPKSHSTVLSILHDLNRCRVTAPTAHYQLTRMINQNHINRKCICCQYTPLHSTLPWIFPSVPHSSSNTKMKTNFQRPGDTVSDTAMSLWNAHVNLISVQYHKRCFFCRHIIPDTILAPIIMIAHN